MTHIATAIVSTEYDGKPRNLYSKLCSQCNSEFFVPKHRLDAQLCCSRKCASAMKHKKSRVEIACYNCGTKTTRAISDLKNSRHQVFFCSRKCKETSQSLQGNCPKIRPDHSGQEETYTPTERLPSSTTHIDVTVVGMTATSLFSEFTISTAIEKTVSLKILKFSVQDVMKKNTS